MIVSLCFTSPTSLIPSHLDCKSSCVHCCFIGAKVVFFHSNVTSYLGQANILCSFQQHLGHLLLTNHAGVGTYIQVTMTWGRECNPLSSSFPNNIRLLYHWKLCFQTCQQLVSCFESSLNQNNMFRLQNMLISHLKHKL